MTARKTTIPMVEPCGNEVLDLLCNRRVFIETYGCRYNFGDTAKLAEILLHNGNTLVDSEEEADAVVVNTCTVVGPTERRMLRRLSQLRSHDLYVTGCMPAVQREAIFAVCTPKIIPPDAIQEKYRCVRTVSGEGVGIVQVARGCQGACTYCITRLARGPLKSFSRDEIHGQVQAFVVKGIPEIQLTAQDVSAWGMDCGGTPAELLTVLGHIPGRYMLRVGMMNPATVMRDLDALVEAFAGNHIFRFIHLPAQSGSDRILKKMGRMYTVQDFEDIVSAFRRACPDITLMTDMIVGFCGETEEDFAGSLELIERVRPNKVNITRYSARPFTPLANEKDFPDFVKKDRSRAMNAFAEKVYTEINRPLLNRKVPVLVTEKIRDGSVMARTPEYLGVVINESLPIGYEGPAILKKDRKYFFIGEPVT
ncbi:tRNA (N(6)-L-threonylcarbamoyladenosine(37)-C(2))-methylthiotransferase [uncultured Methanoregula sp.]|uniref:tRNA (N(6)-L-threonylcarbamoyladenosine(37)-C(2))- methylthiotransferase n=1 Tax=uncultured Methanoregula sp. TaxID=1005933 RepID=UPI002AAB2894|nr:tRNA (N(6)-L-threonylcarbamoyladenosine(37)-C(2))-methylthiotransferase [uncultured Methanoregula sp.]